jgi:hypothetical protein
MASTLAPRRKMRRSIIGASLSGRGEPPPGRMSTQRLQPAAPCAKRGHYTNACAGRDEAPRSISVLSRLDPGRGRSDTSPMGTGLLQIDLAALAANWRALDAMTACRDRRRGQGRRLRAGCCSRGARPGHRRRAALLRRRGGGRRGPARRARAPGPEINVFSGHMAGDAPLLRDAGLTPMLNSPEQLARHRERAARRALWRPARQRHEPAGDGARRLGRHPRGGRGRAHHARHEPPRLRRRARAPGQCRAAEDLPRDDRGRHRPPLALGHGRHPPRPRLPFRPHPPRYRPLRRPAFRRRRPGRAPVAPGDPGARPRPR